MTHCSHASVALVIDDEPFAWLFAVQVLLDDGFTILEAGSAEEGLALLDRNDDISVVVTDISMPGLMNGLDLAHVLREQQPDIAIILTSGHAQPVGSDAPLCTPFVAKPYSASMLLAAIQNTISRLDVRDLPGLRRGGAFSGRF